jgi:hypothetical protein
VRIFSTNISLNVLICRPEKPLGRQIKSQDHRSHKYERSGVIFPLRLQSNELEKIIKTVARWSREGSISKEKRQIRGYYLKVYEFSAWYRNMNLNHLMNSYQMIMRQWNITVKSYSLFVRNIPMKRLIVMVLFASSAFCSTSFGRGLIVISGGYQSCPPDGELISLPHPPEIAKIVDAAAPFIRAIETKEHGADVIWSCFSGVKLEISPFDSMARGPMTFVFGKRHLTRQESPQRVNYASGDIEDGIPLEPFFKFIEDQVSKTGPSGIYIAGHSFGGLTALQLGVRLARKDFKIEGISLIDPISPFQCPANQLAISIAFSGRSPSGCRMAPSDLDMQEMDELQSHTKWLINSYQTKFIPLQSSFLGYLGWSNRLISYFPRRVLFGDVHTYLATDHEPWYFTANMVR